MAASNERARNDAGLGSGRLVRELPGVLGATLGDLLVGKRVAILGDGSTELAARCAEASGRRVHVFDPDPRRTAEAIARGARGGTDVRHALLEGDAELGHGAFDAVLVPDLAGLTSTGALRDVDVLGLTDRMLNARGFAAVMVAAESPGLDYHRLYDLVSASFPAVRMLGIAPFAGVTVAEFGERDADEVSFDASLTEGPEAAVAYVAVASRQSIRLDPYLVVQLAADGDTEEDAPRTEATRDDAHDRAAEIARQAEEARARELGKTVTAQAARIAELEATLAAERTAAEARKREHDASATARERRRDEAHQRDLDAMLERVAELEQSLAEAHASASTSASSERERQAHEFQLAELRKAANEARGEADALRSAAAQAEAAETARRALAAELEKVRAVLAAYEAEAASSESARDLAELEARLKERGERIATRERELREAERIGRELVRDLVKARADRGPAGAAPTVEMAERASALTAELEAARWTIAALERELGERANAGGDVARLEAALEHAHAELARMRGSSAPASA